MKKCDIHVHSRFSIDGKDEAADICRAALDRGLSVLAFTEHYDFGQEDFSGGFYLRHETARQREMDRLAREYKENMELLFGIELGQPQMVPLEARGFMQSRRFDLVIGSVHILSDRRDIYFIDYKDQNAVDEMFLAYFSDMCRLVEFGGFDTLAHLDYPLRVLRGKMESPTLVRYEEQIEKALKALAARGMALEINSRGLLDWQGRVGPEPWVLRRFFELGGEHVTFGSDSHTTRWVGGGFAEQVEAAKAAGFFHVTYFKERKPIKIPFF